MKYIIESVYFDSYTDVRTNIDSFEMRVNSRINDGYKPVGGAVITKERIIQTLIKD